jgi:uncharacterized membrane protein YfcA
MTFGAESLPPWQLALIVLSIAFLYASVGFGGASGYLAAMSLFAFTPQVMSSTALFLNLLVSSIAFVTFYRARYFMPRLLWPFLLTSIPAAFLGGVVQVETSTYLVLLYLSLSYVALRMLFYRSQQGAEQPPDRPLSLATALVAGGAIGLLSGIIGIGGGIFLSPLIVLAGWGTPKQAAASAAGFIFVNSLSGLIGRMIGGSLEIGLVGLALIPMGLLGAIGGSRLGARYLSGTALRRLLGVILAIAVLRYWLGFL